jgi:hypothetical protein
VLSRLLGRPRPQVALPYPPDSAEGLAARWVQWVAAAGPAANPVADETGEHAGANQPDDVWFLAGSYGEAVRRQVAVPAGRPLFLPAFNVWERHAAGPPTPVPSAFGRVVLDGREVDVVEVATPVPFTVTGALLNGVTMRRAATPVTVWGLWAYLPPLAPGGHTLHAMGGDGHGFAVDVTVGLHVVPWGA